MVSQLPLPYGWPLTSGKTNAPSFVKSQEVLPHPELQSLVRFILEQCAVSVGGCASSDLASPLPLDGRQHLTALSLLTSICCAL